MRKLWIMLVLFLLLAGLGWSVSQNETLLKNGKTVLLRIAPVDPRALLLGDYMVLDFAFNRDLTQALHAKYNGGDRVSPRRRLRASGGRTPLPAEGLAVASLDANRAAVFVRLDDKTPLAADEVRLHFRVWGDRASVAGTAFYFQEGFAPAFERAAYGELRLGPDGRSLLIGLRDSEAKVIDPKATVRNRR